MLLENGLATLSVSNQVSKQTNILSRYISSINWDGIFSKIISTVIILILISILFLFINLVGNKIIKQSFKHSHNLQHVASNRLKTMKALIRNIFHYSVLLFYFYAVLSILGVPVGTLIAGAGILSVAIGLGAQGFVNDVITGGFILLEQQLSVGDEVKIGTIEGTVYSVGLRTTQILGYDGTLNYIPNRSITIVSNLSRSDMRALIDIQIDRNKSIDEMKKIISTVNVELTPKYPDITKGPLILGVVDAGSGRMVFRIAIYTKNGAQAPIQRAFLTQYLKALHKNGFVIPSSPLNIAPK
ncbi:mechanosensitive ion channel family protein [Ligilactobacillus sp. WILCCON 0076]|uniref:Mechanosensitive ion channel family protein n=1 Tax=Ligilactobacillus ubinensis TaxID=2876789 RepID=A0A9X2FHM4_9LACO|nr:mechanosensitive ion channel domain-containing protein [Ligilactobacillus ubinensis]MCP0886282.1 mechanosensitive ion channel family protein [Ligilactobacillus ubinensis]